MRKISMMLIGTLSAVLFFTVSCNKELEIETPTKFDESIAKKAIFKDNPFVEDDPINILFEEMAKSLAKNLKKHPHLRKHIKDEANKKLDGDYDILYARLRGKEFNGKKLNKLLYDEVPETQKHLIGENPADALYDKIPILQISVPINIEEWNTDNYTPLVAYVPSGISSKELEYIRAFDSKGNLFILHKDKVPSEPLIVISKSERYTIEDVEGNNKKQMALPPDPEDGGGGGGGCTPHDYCNRDANPGMTDYVSYASFKDISTKRIYENYWDGDAEILAYYGYIYQDANENITKHDYKSGSYGDFVDWKGGIKLAPVNFRLIDFNKPQNGAKMVVAFIEEDNGITDNKILKKIIISIVKIILKTTTLYEAEFDIGHDSNDWLVGAYEINYDDKEFCNSKGKFYNTPVEHERSAYNGDFYFYVRQQ